MWFNSGVYTLLMCSLWEKSLVSISTQNTSTWMTSGHISLPQRTVSSNDISFCFMLFEMTVSPSYSFVCLLDTFYPRMSDPKWPKCHDSMAFLFTCLFRLKCRRYSYTLLWCLTFRYCHRRCAGAWVEKNKPIFDIFQQTGIRLCTAASSALTYSMRGVVHLFKLDRKDL